jgi:aromatic ring-opening dioxygenase catalytic subunit (LigB family)
VRTLPSVQPQAREQFCADHETALVDDCYCLGRHHTREEGILILSGGLTIHNLRDPASFVPETANPLVREFNDAVSSAISISDVSVPFGVSQHVCFVDAVV